MHIPRLLGVALLTSAAFAQNTIVSPIGATTVEGSSGNAFPFASTTSRRYQQIHDDVQGSPKLITMLSFRINQTTSNLAGTRIFDLDLYLGEGGRSALAPSYTFDNNYLGGSAGKVLVMPRQNVTFGPQGQGISPGPNPFTGNMDLVLNTPFPYTGIYPLVWETTIYGVVTGAAGSYTSLDAEQGVVTSATSTITGTGCVATGQTAAMTHGLQVADIAGTLVMNFTVTAGPANAFCLASLGFTNPNTNLPGLCSPMLTDLAAVMSIGITNASGAITTSQATQSTLVFPNTVAGLPLFSQVHALDVGQPGLPISNSNGRSFTIPSSNLTRVDRATRIFNNAGGTTATEGIFFTSTIGYSVVTQFTY